MKFIVLLACLLAVPFLGTLLRASPKSVPWVAFAIGFLPFVLGSWGLYFAPVSWADWPGWPKGLEVSLIDFICLAVIFSLKGRPSFSAIAPWLLYIVAALIPIPVAVQKFAALFYVWQSLRMFVVFVAAAQLARIPGASERLLYGVIAGVLFQTYYALNQYLHGVNQPGGAFGAQNLLGLMTNFALIPSIILLLVQKRPVWALFGLAAGLLLDFLTASRATMGLAAIGIMATIVLSCAKGITSRKVGITAIILAICAVMAPLALHSMAARRGEQRFESSNMERAAFKRAAWMVIRDYPFGTGPNQYVMVANIGGYSQRAGVTWVAGSRGTSVHNSYLLVWAETGLLGLIAMLLLLWTPVWRGLRTAFHCRHDPRSETLLAFSVALMVFGIHLLFEWLWVMFTPQYLFAAYAGFTMGLIAELRGQEVPMAKRRGRPLSISATARISSATGLPSS